MTFPGSESLPFLESQKMSLLETHSSCRRFLNGVLGIARTGAQWRELPKRFGKWHSVSQRAQRWGKKGIWERLLTEVPELADLERSIPDSTVIRAHPGAAGAKGGQKIHP
jgi:transposase